MKGAAAAAAAGGGASGAADDFGGFGWGQQQQQQQHQQQKARGTNMVSCRQNNLFADRFLKCVFLHIFLQGSLWGKKWDG